MVIRVPALSPIYQSCSISQFNHENDASRQYSHLSAKNKITVAGRVYYVIAMSVTSLRYVCDVIVVCL